jgi:microcystin-dependent protein
MALESASWISDLDTSNPATTDQKKQGDDHLRLIKTALKACFPNAFKAFYFPVTTAKTADFTVAAADMNKTFVVSTAAGVVTATLPTLASGDAGWECFFLKTNTETNALFVAPASGTIQSGDQAGLAKVRRCIPGVRSRVFWTGSAWYAERVVNVPLGTVLDIPRSGLPVGYEYANGQMLGSASTSYPEFYASNGSSGVVTDRRGRAAFGRNTMSNSNSGRLGNTGGEANVDTLGGAIGAETKTLGGNEIPAHTHAVTGTTSNENVDHNHQFGLTTGTGQAQIGSGQGVVTSVVAGGASSAAPTQADSQPHNHTFNVTSASTGGGLAFSKVPPGILTNFMVVVE